MQYECQQAKYSMNLLFGGNKNISYLILRTRVFDKGNIKSKMKLGIQGLNPASPVKLLQNLYDI